MLRLDGHRLLRAIIGNAALAVDPTLGLKPRSPMKPVGLHPALNRMLPISNCSTSSLGLYPSSRKSFTIPQPELHREGQGSGLPLRPGCGTLGCSHHPSDLLSV